MRLNPRLFSAVTVRTQKHRAILEFKLQDVFEIVIGDCAILPAELNGKPAITQPGDALCYSVMCLCVVRIIPVSTAEKYDELLYSKCNGWPIGVTNVPSPSAVWMTFHPAFGLL